MSIVVRFHPSNATKEKYDESLRRMEAAGIWPDPPGGHHRPMPVKKTG